jgi:hypothetical protein
MNEQLLRAFIREKLILEAKKDKPLTALQRLRQHFGKNHYGGMAVKQKGRQSGVASGANRITGDAVNDNEALVAKFPPEWSPQVLGRGLHSSKYKTVKLTIPNPSPQNPQATQIRYAVWDDGGASGPAMLKDQMLGYVCEHALAAAINDQGWDPKLMEGDARLSKYFALPPDDPIRKTVDHFAKGAIAVAKQGLAAVEPKLPKDAKVGTSGDDVVDVQTGTADCHVKYNDPVRLIGLQRLSGKSKRNMGDDILTAIASDDPAAYKTLLDEIEEELPATTAWKMAREEFAFQVFGRSLKDLVENPDSSQEELMFYQREKYREAFLKFLEGEEVTVASTPLKGAPADKTFTSEQGNVRAQLEDRLHAFMLTGEEGENAIYFFNFEGEVSPPSPEENAPELGAVSVGLTIKKIGMNADEVRVVQRIAEEDGDSTHLYKVELKGEDAAGTVTWTEIGQIEMRTRGTQMHPPQIKTKKGQKFADDVIAIPLEALPEVTTEDIMSKKILVTRRELETIISESLLLEDLTGTDKSEIKRMIRKEIEGTVNKKMIDKSFKKNFDKELKKALGVSFFGTPGKINKFVVDEIHDEVAKILGTGATRELVVHICKDVIIKLYRELSFSYQPVIRRLKV